MTFIIIIINVYNMTITWLLSNYYKKALFVDLHVIMHWVVHDKSCFYHSQYFISNMNLDMFSKSDLLYYFNSIVDIWQI